MSSELARIAEEYGLEPEDLLAPPEPTASHLSEADEAFLASVTGRPGHIAIVVDRGLEAHYEAARALGLEPTVDASDIPEASAADEHWQHSARVIRSRTRELERQARAAAVRDARPWLKPGA